MDELNKKEKVQDSVQDTEKVSVTNETDSAVQKQPSGNFLLGTLGALLGGFIAAIPWVLVYIFGDMIFSALALLIAIGALKGYQLFKGKIDKKLPIILTIVCLIVIVVTTLVIIPFAMLAEEGYSISFEYLKRVYSIEGFLSDISQDLITSIIFTALGISGIITNVNNQVKMSKMSNVSDTLDDTSVVDNNDEVFGSIKNIFKNHNAVDKEHTIDKTTIKSELEQIKDGKKLFKMLKKQKAIHKTKGGFYLSEETEQSTTNRDNSQKINLLVTIAIIIVAAIAMCVINYMDDADNTDTNTIDTETAQQTPYVSEEFGMKITLPKSLIYVSGDSLDYVFGTGASSFYEFAAYSKNSNIESDMISCFIVPEMKEDEVDTYLTSVKDSFMTDGFTVVNDFKEEEISGFNFKTIEFQIDVEGVLYNDLCMTYFKDGNLIFIEYNFFSNDRDRVINSLSEIIQQNN